MCEGAVADVPFIKGELLGGRVIELDNDGGPVVAITQVALDACRTSNERDALLLHLLGWKRRQDKRGHDRRCDQAHSRRRKSATRVWAWRRRRERVMTPHPPNPPWLSCPPPPTGRIG